MRTVAVRKIVETDLVQECREPDRDILHKPEKAWQSLHQEQAQEAHQGIAYGIVDGDSGKPDAGLHCTAKPSPNGTFRNSVRDALFDVSAALRFAASLPILLIIVIYRYLVSPGLPRSCNFTPTCSQYALEAVAKHGIIRGGMLSAKRIWRCRGGNPGGFDPVP